MFRGGTATRVIKASSVEQAAHANGLHVQQLCHPHPSARTKQLSPSAWQEEQ